MPDTPVPDAQTVDVPIPIEASLAPALDDPVTRAIAGRMLSRMLQPVTVESLFEVVREMQAEARKRGLTDDILDAELAAYNAERRDAPLDA